MNAQNAIKRSQTSCSSWRGVKYQLHSATSRLRICTRKNAGYKQECDVIHEPLHVHHSHANSSSEVIYRQTLSSTDYVQFCKTSHP